MKIIPLDRKRHKRETFDCGVEVLNAYLQRFAGQQADKDHARTYVAEADENGAIAGFYTLTMIQLQLRDIPASMQKSTVPYKQAALSRALPWICGFKIGALADICFLTPFAGCIKQPIPWDFLLFLLTPRMGRKHFTFAMDS